jgi:hypothetical protein
MTTDIQTAVAALESLTLKELLSADENSLRKFYHLTRHWHDLAAAEHERRATDVKK